MKGKFQRRTRFEGQEGELYSFFNIGATKGVGG